MKPKATTPVRRRTLSEIFHSGDLIKSYVSSTYRDSNVAIHSTIDVDVLDVYGPVSLTIVEARDPGSESGSDERSLILVAVSISAGRPEIHGVDWNVVPLARSVAGDFLVLAPEGVDREMIRDALVLIGLKDENDRL